MFGTKYVCNDFAVRIYISYYDYQLGKARWNFSDEVLDLELRCCHWQRPSFSMVTMRFAASDVKGRQVATRNEASCR